MKTRSNDNTNKGQAILELALVLPFLVVLVLGIFDFACVIRATNSISNISREGANLASRTSLAPNDIMTALADTAQSLNLQNKGMIYITVVQGVTGGTPKIQTQTGWQNSILKNTITSRIGTPTPSNPNPNAQYLGALNLTTGQTASVVEVFYNYQSLFSTNVKKLATQYYSRTIF
jgi:Flp pilus assembly protein TadG